MADIHRFSDRKWALTMYTLWILGSFLNKLDKYKCSLALPNIKYNFAVLFFETNVMVICLYF